MSSTSDSSFDEIHYSDDSLMDDCSDDDYEANLIPSTTGSSVQKRFKYDVFLSFRGEDTRKSFVDHLYKALDDKGIITYKDDEKIQKGERIDQQLIRSIEESRFYIIVFSKNYASSSWCLDELVKIMECQKMTEHTAYPIFYDVEPTEVRNQSGAVGGAFAKQAGKEGAERWRDALKEAAGLAGWELKDTVDGHEAKFIQKIVKDISLRPHFITWSIDGKLVGMEARVKEVVSSLELDSDDVRMIGIKGMGGGGKTTLARAVFDHISYWFDAKCFVENVREGSKASGLKELQKQVLQDVSNDQSIVVRGVSDGTYKMKRIMGSKKVLIVLDDVDDIDQLEALAGEATWFKPGSRILITTRDKQVLVEHDIHAEYIHDVNLLTRDEAICLFSKYAFKTEVPIQGYEGLSEEVVSYADGLPLTIKVLGSFLRGKTETEWVDALERLKTIPLEKTLKVLEISYDGLENDHKEIFLDVACYLKGEEIDKAITILESCGLHAEIGLKVLEQKSLITVSDDGCLDMHDQIEEMGWNIIRRSHPREPERHSRLHIGKEIENILVKELGTDATLSILLRGTDLHAGVVMKGLRKMKKLRFLDIYPGELDIHEVTEWDIAEVDKYLPNSLQSLYWDSYPFRYLPKTFEANKLVNLDMENSHISQLWEGGEKKVLNKLRFLNLSYSKLRTFDFGLTPHLEKLDLHDCHHFVELNMPVECPKLKSLVLNGSKLSKLYMGRLTPQLETLDLGRCNDLVELHMPAECPKLKSVVLNDSKLRTFDIRMTTLLERLDLGGCVDFVEIHMPVECPRLQSLVLNGSKLSKLYMGLTPQLKTLDLGRCNDLVELYMPAQCPKLKSVVLNDSKLRTFDLRMTTLLERLDLGGCVDFVELQMPVECPRLKSIVLNGSKLSKLYMGLTPQLETLDLGRCNDLVELHMPVECRKLKSVVLNDSKLRTFDLRMTTLLERLDLRGCVDFVELHLPVECPWLKDLVLEGTKLSKLYIGVTPQLETLNLGNCNDLVELHMSVECPKLKSLVLTGSKLSNLYLGLTPQLETLDLERCNDLVELHLLAVKLKSLVLYGSKLSKLYMGLAPQLETLDLGRCNDLVELHMPVECPKLKSLVLCGSRLRTFDLGRAPYLEKLDLKECYSLQEVYARVEYLKKLVHLNLSGCCKHFLVDRLHESTGLDSTATLELTAEPLDKCPLHPNSSLPNFQFKCKYEEPLPSVSGNFEKLISFGLCACTNLESFSASICGLQHLRVLTLEGSIPEVPKDLHQLECLEELTLWMKEIKQIPDNICMLKHLKLLKLRYCELLEQLPKDLGRLECLEELHLTDCISLREIPNSICNMKCLKYLDLHFCILVDKLPEEIGRLTSLEEINIEGAGIRHLPQSIFRLKGLYIVGSTWRLKSYGFTSLRNISEYTASCYIRDSQHDSLRTQEADSQTSMDLS